MIWQSCTLKSFFAPKIIRKSVLIQFYADNFWELFIRWVFYALKSSASILPWTKYCVAFNLKHSYMFLVGFYCRISYARNVTMRLFLGWPRLETIVENTHMCAPYIFAFLILYRYTYNKIYVLPWIKFSAYVIFYSFHILILTCPKQLTMLHMKS